MKTLTELFDEIYIPQDYPRYENGILKGYTDKNTDHSYIDVYTELFKDKRATANKVLEIGIYYGGSMVLWEQYFEKAHIYGLDINGALGLESKPRITQIIGDAYSDQIVNNLDNDFDIVIDDGPHTLLSMVNFIEKYLPKLKSDGILVIEDIQDMSWIPVLTSFVPDEIKDKIKIYDIRHVKNRWDDIIFAIKL